MKTVAWEEISRGCPWKRFDYCISVKKPCSREICAPAFFIQKLSLQRDQDIVYYPYN